MTLMLQRLDAQDRKARPSDAELLARAQRLSRDYFGGRAVAASVRWVDNQRSRWGSCTVDDASIRLSARMRGMPDYVIDYVLVHELAHLLEPGHNARFWKLVDTYPRTERARGFLEGVAASAQLSIVED